MTKSKHPSLLDGDKTLSLEQIAECYKSFINGFKHFLVSPQIKQTKETSRIKIEFIPKSKSYVVVSPSIVIEDREECAGFQKYRTLILTASNCGLCRGTKSVTFNNTTIHKFAESLEIVIKLFNDHTIEAFKQDKQMLEWEQIVSLTRELFGENTKKHERGYTETYLYKIKGNINPNDREKNFDIHLQNLNPSQMSKLAKVIKDL